MKSQFRGSARELAEELQGLSLDDAEKLIQEWLDYVLNGPKEPK